MIDTTDEREGETPWCGARRADANSRMILNNSATNADGGSGSQGSVPRPHPDEPPHGGAAAAGADQANVRYPDRPRLRERLLVEEHGVVAS